MSSLRLSVMLLGLASLSATGLLDQDLPDLPELRLESFDPEIREIIKKAQDNVQTAPTAPEANGRLGMVLHAHRQHQAALVCYQRAHNLDIKSFSWAYYLAIVEKELGHLERALLHFDQALQLRPDSLPAQLRYSDILLTRGATQQSLQSYMALVEQHPDAPEVHYGLGKARAAKGDLAGAIASYQRACEFFPAFGAAHYALALAYQKQGKKSEAAAHFAAYRAHPDTRPSAADPQMEAIESLVAGARYYLERGLQLQSRGKIKDAVKEYHKALEADPDYAAAHANLLSAHVALEQWSKAEHHYQALIQVQPNLAEAHFNYGLLLSATNRAAEAAAAFRQALGINPYYSEAHNNLGYLLVQQGQLEEAEQHFRSALQARPGYEQALYNLGRTLLRRQRPHEAISPLEQAAMQQSQETPQILYTLADTYAQAGFLEKAVQTAERALEAARALGQDVLAERIQKELARIQKHQLPTP